MIRSFRIALALVCAPISAQISAQVAPLPNGVEVARGGLAIRVEALTDSILRVRLAPGGQWAEDASWAVPAAVRHQRVAVEATPDGFRTAALVVHVNPGTLALTLTDPQGHTIVDD
ncbi:MAG TPA: DUF4968 domain-containing protein, partial [Sphingomicrobium sp.]|nr:DUF4968 domain-containing protein [Sphingomicrobium sp.]